MNLLKKVLWLLIISIISLNATDQTQVCQAFKDGIQTRANDSKIKFINNSRLFNNPDNRLNGFQVINKNSTLSCRDVNGTSDEVCQSSNALGMSVPLIFLHTAEVFTFTEAVNNATHIKMKNLKVKKNKNLNLTASSAIYLERLEVAKNSTVTITAPKVVIGHLSSFKKSNIKIIADTIDIKIIKLENKADLIIESFSEDTEVEMRVEKLKLKKASVLLNNGLYHIKRVELKNRSSLKVGDSVQIVNRRTIVLNHSRINASKDSEICDDEHNPNALFIYSNDLVRVENHSKIVAMVYNDRRVEFTKHAGLKGAISAKNRAIFKNHSKVCYAKCNLTSISTDITPPVLTLNGNNNITLQVGGTYTELGATALDDVDGNVSVSITGSVDTNMVGVYTLTYTARDSANNSVTKTRTINVVPVVIIDTTPPVITLNGEVNLTLTQGDSYNELGATALDDVDGNVSVSISGSVDTSTVGVYTLTYTASDSASNSSSKTRTIKVQEKINKVEKLTLTAEKTNFIRRKEPYSNRYVRIREPVKVMATYEDGHSEEVTDNVIWSGANYGKVIKIIANQLTIGKPKNTKTTLMASLGTVNSNVLEIDISNEEERLLEVEIFNKDKKRFPNRDAEIILSLMHKLTTEVKLRLTLKESDGVKFYDAGRSRELTLTKELIFIPDNPRQEGYVNIVDQDANNTKPYTIITEMFESEDLQYAGENPKDIVVTPSELKLIAPPITERRGAIRGVTINFRVTSKNINLKYKLINPPVGMEIIGRSDFGEFAIGYIDGVDIKWNVPMNIEEKSYTITTEATDIDGSTIEVSFDIKVPKTNLIETKIVNNELIVTDKNSNLFGMKMKGHSGEDISELRLRSVAYEDVWKKKVKKKKPEDIVERTVFVIDNMPEKLDMKFPEYINNYLKRRELGLEFRKYSEAPFIDIDSWEQGYSGGYEYEETKGMTLQHKRHGVYGSDGSKVYILILAKAQSRGN